MISLPWKNGSAASSDFDRTREQTFDSLNRFVENHLPREAAMHRLGRVETAGFEQLVRRRSTAAHGEKLAAGPALFDSVGDFADRSLEAGGRDVGSLGFLKVEAHRERSEVLEKCKLLVRPTERLRRQHRDDAERYVPAVQCPHGLHDKPMRPPARSRDALAVVQPGRPVDAQAEPDAVVAEKITPAVVDEQAIRLDRGQESYR